MQFSVKLDTLVFGGEGVLSLNSGYSWHILSLALLEGNQQIYFLYYVACKIFDMQVSNEKFQSESSFEVI